MGTCGATPDTGKFWSPADLAALFGPPVTVASVYEWNYRGTGPKYLKIGRHIWYRPEDVEAWLREQEVDPRAPNGESGEQNRRGGPAVRPETRPAATTTERRRPSGSESEPSS